MVAASNVTSVASQTSFFFIEDSFSVQSVDRRLTGVEAVNSKSPCSGSLIGGTAPVNLLCYFLTSVLD